ncbi:MAG: pyrroline-5-carboxylate reductase [Clostridium sp.]|jgi:pyrroline-5-carboxylate reductase|nr:pyrroline-5-carboxylate reductase [Clostridium sp.]
MARKSKYGALTSYFSRQTDESITVTIDALENILGFKLPPSAHQRTWWANTPGAPQARAWTAAGYRANGFHGNAVTFTKAELWAGEKRSGRPPNPAMNPASKKPARKIVLPPAHTAPPRPIYETAATRYQAAAPAPKGSPSVGMIGTGNLGGAILQGIAESGGLHASSICIYDKDAEKTAALAREYGFRVAESEAGAAETPIVIVAVKPTQLPDVLRQINASLEEKRPLVVSTAAGWSLAQIGAHLPVGTAVARIMPNLNAAVGESATVYSVNNFVNENQAAALELLLKTFGSAQKIDERSFDAHLAISGAGPAFAYLFADALARAGVRLGLPRAEAQAAAVQTLLGSAETLRASGLHPQELVDRVCSPGGITIEGVLKLEETGFASSVAQAVQAAFEKNKAL